MRAFSPAAKAAPHFACVCRFQQQRVSRKAVIERWNLRVSEPDKVKTVDPAGKGMRFAAAIGSNTWTVRRSDEGSVVLGVAWVTCERLDYYVHYNVPSSWTVVEHVSDNSVAIQCRPPVALGRDANGPTVHGFSVNCFAYKQKVKEPNCERLLNLFLRRFGASVSNSLVVLSKASGCGKDNKHEGAKEQSISEMLANQLHCAVAEVTFTPLPGEPLAHGLCRAFYNSNRRFHYVVVVAVPDDEFVVSKDLLTHALLAVVESRVESAPKGT